MHCVAFIPTPTFFIMPSSLSPLALFSNQIVHGIRVLSNKMIRIFTWKLYTYIVAHCRKHYWIKYHVFAFDRFKKCEMLSRNVSFALLVIGIFIPHFISPYISFSLFKEFIFLFFFHYFFLSMCTSFIIVIGILYVHVLLYDNQCIQCV